MPQKPLKKAAANKKAPAANRHGKIAKTKKGRLDKGPKNKKLVAQHKEAQELTKGINFENEQRVAGVAAAAGGKLSVLKPPVLESADAKQKKKAKGAAIRAGVPWGASSH